MAKTILRKAKRTGIIAERQAERWLHYRKKYVIEYSHKGKPSNLPFDIIARKGKERILIDVKSGKHPQISMDNLSLLLAMPTKKIPQHLRRGLISHVGYIFATSDSFYLFKISRNVYIGQSAWNKKIKEGKKFWSRNKIRLPAK